MQQPNAIYINKIGGEIKFTAEKVLPRAVLLFFLLSVYSDLFHKRPFLVCLDHYCNRIIVPSS